MGKQISNQVKTINKKSHLKNTPKSKSSSSKSLSTSQKSLKTSTSMSSKQEKQSTPIKVQTKTIKKKVYKKTPIKASIKPVVLISKRQPKKTERALESAEQAKLFQTLKLTVPVVKTKSPTKQKVSKKVSFNLKGVVIQKAKALVKKKNLPHKVKQPLQSIMKQVSVEDRITDLEKKVAEIFQILNSKKLK